MEAQALASFIPSPFSKSVLSHGSRACNYRLKIISGAAWRRLGMRNSTKASSSTGDTLVGTSTPQIAPKNKISKISSPLLWIAVGVGLSAWFSVMATKVKRYAINQSFKAVMGEKAEENGEFNISATSLPSQPAEASDDLNLNIPPTDAVITDIK